MKSSPVKSKEEIRIEALSRRNGMSDDERAEASLAICNRVMDQDMFLDARGIHVYLPIGSEVDIRPLIDVAWEMGKSVGMMRVMEDGESVQFKIVRETRYRTSALGIAEPLEADEFDMNSCDLVIAPLVAADRDCNRVGYGKGYYDQFMTQFPRPTLGVAFDLQIVDSIPVDELDIKVDAIITETRVIAGAEESQGG